MNNTTSTPAKPPGLNPGDKVAYSTQFLENRTPLAGFSGCRPAKPLSAFASLGELIPRIPAAL